MSKKWKVRISLLLCAVLLNTLPGEGNILAQILEVSVYAQEEDWRWSESGSNPNYSGNNSGSGSMSSSADSDENKVTYNLDGSGVLVISGNGIIPAGKFYRRQDIKKVIIGSGITEIGESAFQAPGVGLVRSLESVIFEEGSQLKKIGRKAFYNAQIKEISLPEGVEIIGEEAFYNNQVNKELIIPASVETFGKRVFQANSALEKVVFSNGSKCIEFSEGLFQSCSKLKSITFPAGLKTINRYALAGDTFGELKIPNSVTSISESALIPLEDSQYGIPTPINVYLDCDSPLKPDISWVNPYNAANNPSKVIKHDFTVENKDKEGAKIADATCTVGTKYQKSCSKCGIVANAEEDLYVEEDIFYGDDAKGHDFTKEDTSKEGAKIADATCTEGSKYHKSCSVCGELSTEDADIFVLKDALGHIDENDDGICDRAGCGYVFFINGLWIDEIPDQTYSGKAIVPQIKVHFKNKELVLNEDYTVKITDNIKVGTAKVTITGQGDYSQMLEKEFNILAADFSSTSFSADDIFIKPTGNKIKPKPVLYWNNKKLAATYYSYQYFAADEAGEPKGDALLAVKDAGEYVIVLTAKDGSNFKGARKIKLTLIDDTHKLASKLALKIKKSVPYANGSEVRPEVVVKDGITLLVENKDYTVQYENNTEVGIARVIITGLGKYAGSKSASFRITGTSLAKVKVEGIAATVPYTGKEITFDDIRLYFKATSKSGQVNLVKGRDYEISSYENNIKAGMASVIITGKGGYTGKIRKTFKITPYVYTEDSGRIRLDLAESVEYCKGGAKPEVTVTFICEDKSVITLKENTDYKVKYLNNKAVNDGSNESKLPTVKVTLKGSYKGVISKTFKITANNPDM